MPGQSAGRKTPLMRPMSMMPPVSTAPVEPAETNAAASGSSFKMFMPTTREESRLERMACVGTSSLVISSVQCLISTREASCGVFASSARMRASSPVKRMPKLFRSFSASSAPFTISAGALSPPIASTTTLIISISFTLARRAKVIQNDYTISFRKRQTKRAVPRKNGAFFTFSQAESRRRGIHCRSTQTEQS